MKEENILYLARGFSQRSLSAGMLSRPMTASLSVYSMAELDCTGTLVCSGLQVAHNTSFFFMLAPFPKILAKGH